MYDRFRAMLNRREILNSSWDAAIIAYHQIDILVLRSGGKGIFKEDFNYQNEYQRWHMSLRHPTCKI